jgi:hypothetical protein
MSKFNLTGITNKLIEELNALGIECYLWHAATTGSQYIRFADSRMCSVRLGDHPGKDKLKYKYNVRSDISHKHRTWVKDGNVWRYYVPQQNWRNLIPVLQERHKQIQTWPPSQYKYNIPDFKKEAILRDMELEFLPELNT